MRLIQLAGPEGRRVGLVEDRRVGLLACPSSIYSLAQQALSSGTPLTEVVGQSLSPETLDYDAIYTGASAWRILPSIDHPVEPARCLISGTGLSHTGSARNRQAMHAVQAEQMTDSMRMFQCCLLYTSDAADE